MLENNDCSYSHIAGSDRDIWYVRKEWENNSGELHFVEFSMIRGDVCLSLKSISIYIGIVLLNSNDLDTFDDIS